jgi:hypothetical protein
MGFIEALTGFFAKIFTLKQSSTIVLSFIASSFLATSIEAINKIFFKDADGGIFIPIFIEVFMCIIYILMVLADFYYGVRVSIIVKNEKFKASRIMDTTVKVIASILVTATVAFFCMLAEATHKDWLSFPAIVILLLVWLVLILSDYVSIGDNIKKLYGSKPKMFSVVENALAIIVKKLMANIEGNSFNLKNNEDEKDNSDNIN